MRPPQARREKPRVSAFTSANIHKILALRPDLVLTFSDLEANIAADLIRGGAAGMTFPCFIISSISNGSSFVRPVESEAARRTASSRTIGPANDKTPFGAPCGFRVRLHQLGEPPIPAGIGKFESVSLHRRVCELLVPIRRSRSRSDAPPCNLTSVLWGKRGSQ